MLFFWRRSGLKRLYCCTFRLILVASICLSIGVFVFNILLVNQRPSVVEKDEVSRDTHLLLVKSHIYFISFRQKPV